MDESFHMHYAAISHKREKMAENQERLTTNDDLNTS